jgi:sigma-E factor negative regulatory protein RseC
MYEIVTVTQILTNQKIEVSCISSACNGCKGAAFCNTKNKTFEAWNKHQLSIIEGDVVEIYLPSGRTIASTLMTLIAPLLFFPVAYYGATYFGLSEGPSFLLALGGIALGLVLVWLFFKHQGKHYLPVIEKNLSQERQD